MTRRRYNFRPFNPEFAEDEPCPSAHEYETARIELGPWASDEQVTDRAIELMQAAWDADNAYADECEGESQRDDRNWEMT